jgi:hypothetical protein
MGGLRHLGNRRRDSALSPAQTGNHTSVRRDAEGSGSFATLRHSSLRTMIRYVLRAVVWGTVRSEGGSPVQCPHCLRTKLTRRLLLCSSGLSPIHCPDCGARVRLTLWAATVWTLVTDVAFWLAVTAMAATQSWTPFFLWLVGLSLGCSLLYWRLPTLVKAMPLTAR